MDALSRAGVVTVGAGSIRTWDGEAAKILHVLRCHQFGHTDYRYVTPAPNAADLISMRTDLLAVSSVLRDLSLLVKQRMEGSCAVFIPHLGLAKFDTNTRAMLTYALGICLGDPTATDKSRVIWDVKARKTNSTYFSTFSETDQEAAYHSDAQYFAAPEHQFLLYCMEPASCGGGLSSVCDARALRADIERTERWVSEILSDRMLPFRVPTAFLTVPDQDVVQATLAPVFSNKPLIRYRADTLTAGLLHFPEYADADAHRALDAFAAQLASSPHMAQFYMPRDSLVIMNNHLALHARTAFQDPDRHLLRIRLRWEDAGLHTNRYRMVTRVPRMLRESIEG